jgi:ATP-citrate lyase beta-subunit
MAQKNIYEIAGKKLLADQLPKFFPGFNYHNKLVIITPDTDFAELAENNPWIKSEKLVAKPDQLFGKRGKLDLILLDANFEELKQFTNEKLGKEYEINEVTGKLTRLLVEPYVPHEKEYYVSITSNRDGEVIHFSLEGGIFVEENWDKVTHIPIPIGADIKEFNLSDKLPDLGDLNEVMILFIKGLFEVYRDQDFAFLEINPFAVTEDKKIVPLDLKARLDDTAAFLHKDTWGNPKDPITFPAGFGDKKLEEEAKIAQIDEQTGSSLKLEVLNPEGNIWTMVAGGGASVVYTDTIVDYGYGNELGNYGEYSGNPSREHTEMYAQTLINLMTANPDPEGKPKVLLIGGGIANFTDVKATFAGIADAIRNSVDKLKSAKVKIYVRRGGPNEEQGLKLMKDLGDELGLPIDVYDRYTHMTRIVPIAIKENYEGD